MTARKPATKKAAAPAAKPAAKPAAAKPAAEPAPAPLLVRFTEQRPDGSTATVHGIVSEATTTSVTVIGLTAGDVHTVPRAQVVVIR